MCTSIKWLNNDEFYFGRTLDNPLNFGETIVITPRNYLFKFSCEPNLEHHYAMIGMAKLENDYPLYAEGMNEHGLCIAALNFPIYAYYPPYMPNKRNVSPYEFIPYILLQCKTVLEARELLKNCNLVDRTFNDELPLPPLHWMISDKKETIVVEPIQGKLEIYDNPFNVLTNSPQFTFHKENLNNYIGLSNKFPSNSFKPLPFGGYYNWYEGNNDDVRYSKWFNLTDLNGDNFIGDLYFAGSPLPLAHGGWVNELQWKNFDLNVLFNFSIGRKIINEKAGSLNVVGPKFVDYRDLHWWTDPGCDANMPKLGFDVKTNIDTNIEKVNAITLKQITLGYNAPKVWVRKVGLSGVRLFATIENLCYLSNYAGENPEVIDIYSGRDKGTQYPLPRKWTLGLTLNF